MSCQEGREVECEELRHLYVLQVRSECGRWCSSGYIRDWTKLSAGRGRENAWEAKVLGRQVTGIQIAAVRRSGGEQ